MKLLVFTARFPYPLERGDKLRIFFQLRELAQSHELVLVTFAETMPTDEEYAKVSAFCKKIYCFPLSKPQIALNLARGLFTTMPLQIAYYFNNNIKKQVDTIIQNEKPDAIYCHLIRMAEYVRDSQLPKVLDYMDAMSVNVSRSAERFWWLKHVLRREGRLAKQYEASVFNDFDATTIISTQDRNVFDFKHKNDIQIIQNGVDTDFFEPIDTKKEYDFAFIGNMGYLPNVDAAQFLVHKILPLVQQKRPNTRVLLAGARPAAEVKALASEAVTVTGYVEDIREAYASTSLLVAPLFIGSGMQNKILETMAMCVPCITTTMVNNAIGATPDQMLMIADTAEVFAEKIILLLENKELYNDLVQNGYNFVHATYSWAATTQHLNDILVKSFALHNRNAVKYE